jgi:hypothetical protein
VVRGLHQQGSQIGIFLRWLVPFTGGSEWDDLRCYCDRHDRRLEPAQLISRHQAVELGRESYFAPVFFSSSRKVCMPRRSSSFNLPFNTYRRYTSRCYLLLKERPLVQENP